MAKIRMIVIEGDLSVEDVRRLAQGFSAGDEAFTSIQLPNGVTGQAATLSRDEEKPRPRPVQVPVVSEEKPVVVPITEAPKRGEVTSTPAPLSVELPPAIAKVFPEAEPVSDQQDAAERLVADLQGCKRLASLLERLQQAGHQDLPALIEACKQYKDKVPLLQRLGDGLEDRVTRTYEGMK